MKYTVIFHYNFRDFETGVNDAIKNGWEPQGGVAVFYTPNSITYYQAMISNGPKELADIG